MTTQINLRASKIRLKNFRIEISMNSNNHTAPMPPKAEKLKRQTLTQGVEDRIRNEIIQGIHTPGAILAGPVLAKNMGVSRSPVREALMALERDGLVSFDDRGRTQVCTMTDIDFEDLYILRLALEPVAASHTGTHATDELFAALEVNIAATEKTQTVADVSPLDIEFHTLIVNASCRPRLIASWKSLRPQLEFWLTALHKKHEYSSGIVRDLTIKTHLELVETLRSGKSKAIHTAFKEHIEGWYKWLPTMNND